MTSSPHEFVSLIKPATHGMPLQGRIVVVQTQVPLSNRHAGVGVRQHRRENRYLRIESATAITCGVNAHSLLVLTEHQTCPRRRANRSTRISLSKENPLLGQGIHMWCRHLLCMLRIKAYIRISLVIGKDDYYVGRRLASGNIRTPNKPQSRQESPKTMIREFIGDSLYLHFVCKKAWLT